MKLTIPTIVCTGCIDTIVKAIKAIDSQAQITPDLDTKTIPLQTTASIEAIRTAITNTGHQVA